MVFIKEYQEFREKFQEKKESEKKLLSEKDSLKEKHKEEIHKVNKTISILKKEYKQKLKELVQEKEIDSQRFQSAAIDDVTQQIGTLIYLKQEQNKKLHKQLQEIEKNETKWIDYIYINVPDQVTRTMIKDSYLTKLPVTEDEIVENISKYKNRFSFIEAKKQFLAMSFDEIDKRFNKEKVKYETIEEKKDWLAFFRNPNRRGLDTQGFLTELPTYAIIAFIFLIIRWLFKVSIGALADNTLGRFSFFSGISNFLTIVLNIIGYGPFILLIVSIVIFLGSKLLNITIKKPFKSHIDKQLLETNAVLYYLFASYDDSLVYKMSQEKTIELPHFLIQSEQLDKLYANCPELAKDSIVQTSIRSFLDGENYKNQLANFEKSMLTGKKHIHDALRIVAADLDCLGKDKDLGLRGEFHLIQSTVELNSIDRLNEYYDNKKRELELEQEQEINEREAEKEALSIDSSKEIKMNKENLQKIKEEKRQIIQNIDDLTEKLKKNSPELTEIEMTDSFILDIVKKKSEDDIQEWIIVNHRYSALFLVYSTPNRKDKKQLFSHIITNLLRSLTQTNSKNLFCCYFVDEYGMGVNILNESQSIKKAKENKSYVNLVKYGDYSIKEYFEDLDKKRDKLVKSDIETTNRQLLNEFKKLGMEDDFKLIRYNFPIIDLDRTFAYKALATMLEYRSKGLGVIPIYFIEQQEFIELKKDKDWATSFDDAFEDNRVLDVSLDTSDKNNHLIKFIKKEKEQQ
ncbi:hypothetical protein [Carnobacterium sp. TMP28]|uniref:hypothetical protein n=1 Tax=Carnobacterium sp. TMP28 TaxID=3397060 RepID=UPI0039DFEE42